MKKTDYRIKEQVEVVRKSNEDWNYFVRVIGGIHLDQDQKNIISAIQNEKRVSVRSGVSRGKDYAAAWAAFCFFALTPEFRKLENGRKELVSATKVAMTAPTDRQIKNIMFPEITKIYWRVKDRFPLLINPFGMRLVGYDIRTAYEEWFLTGFKADDKNTEAWSGFHAPNIMFVVTEASGIDENIFDTIEGNLQGNSRILIVFNPNVTSGYAARSTKQRTWVKFKLNSLDSENVKAHKIVIQGQVDYEWVKDKVEYQCREIEENQKLIEKNDFEFEGKWYRPNDWFRKKVLAEFPETAIDTLIPESWITAANQRWKEFVDAKNIPKKPLKLGIDVAGMGNDDTVMTYRYRNFVKEIIQYNAGGKANHMETAGRITVSLKERDSVGIIDTIGEGAGVFSKCEENNLNVYSYKSGNAVKGLQDVTGLYEFANLRDYTYWAIRDWLNPDNEFHACLPECPELMEELAETKWHFDSLGRPRIEPKEELKERLKRSPDTADSLAITFYPDDWIVRKNSLYRLAQQL